MRRNIGLTRAGGFLFGALLIVASSVVLERRAWAGDCGGAVVCSCGDRVVASVTLNDDLNGCDENGLILETGILDCANHQISGPGDRTDWAGVVVEGAVGATVKNCRIRNFGDGVRIDGGSGNRVIDNEIFSNRHGVWLGDGATSNFIEQNEVHDNQDEGVHVGSTTSFNQVTDNYIHHNDGENLYLLGTQNNLVTDNVLDSADEAGILLKHSQNNTFIGNQNLSRPVKVRGDSWGNHFEDNVLVQGGYVFEALEEEDGTWTYPHGQTVLGGSIDASTCFEFLGSYENTASAVVVDDCRHVKEKEFGDLVPFGNVVSVIDLSPGTGPDGDAGGTGSSTGARKGKIRLTNLVGDDRDKLKLEFDFTPGSQIDPASNEVEITLSDADSIVYRVTLPPGTIEQQSSSFYRFEGNPAESPGGLQLLRIRNHPILGWSLYLKAQSNLDGAQEANLTLEWRIGNDESSVSDEWAPKSSGWQLH
ncbi:MAG: right-handed parallel beta-helix repeat-containing protein [Deltaproteobacteria bacterium]|nr:right-handed parallel beta-helix repeat-containing protein [Deltaproteobacteria bacterium]